MRLRPAISEVRSNISRNQGNSVRSVIWNEKRENKQISGDQPIARSSSNAMTANSITHFPVNPGSEYTRHTATRWTLISIRTRVLPHSLRAAPLPRSFLASRPWQTNPNGQRDEMAFSPP